MVSGKVVHTSCYMPFVASLFQRGRFFLQTLLACVGLADFQRKRSFEILYTVSLRNTSALSRRLSLVLPKPPTEESHQTVLTLEGTPSSSSEKREASSENRFHFWEMELAPQEEKVIIQHLTVTIQPTDVRSLRSSKQTIHDYTVKQREETGPFLKSSAHTTLSEEELQAFKKHLEPEKTPVVALLETIQDLVCEKLIYGNPISGLYSAQEATGNKIVDCGGFDTLFVALCHACDIPARLVSGFWTAPSKHAMHAWVEAFHPSGVWIPVDPSVEYLRRLKRTLRSGSVGYIGSDHLIYSKGCDLLLPLGDTSLLADILQTPLLLQDGDEIQMVYTFTATPL